jgi:ArsR family transcriptional regulator
MPATAIRKSRTTLPAEQTEQIARALADPTRYAILQQIAASDGIVKCAALDCKQTLSPATVSHHMKELCEAGLIDVAREGRCANLSFRRDTWDAYLAQLASL